MHFDHAPCMISLVLVAVHVEPEMFRARMSSLVMIMPVEMGLGLH